MSAVDPSSNSNAVVDADVSSAAVYDGPRCVKCESPLEADQVVCRACGYYASLGITVEIDQQWESAIDSAAPVVKQNAMEEFFAAIPGWALPIAVTNLLIIAAAVAGRLLLPAESVVLEFWGVWQLVVGLVLIVAMHIACFHHGCLERFQPGYPRHCRESHEGLDEVLCRAACTAVGSSLCEQRYNACLGGRINRWWHSMGSPVGLGHRGTH